MDTAVWVGNKKYVIPDQNKDCVFPFKWGGFTYSGCTTARFGNGGASFDDLKWCGTQSVVTSEAGWGICSPSCPLFQNY